MARWVFDIFKFKTAWGVFAFGIMLSCLTAYAIKTEHEKRLKTILVTQSQVIIEHLQLKYASYLKTAEDTATFIQVSQFPTRTELINKTISYIDHKSLSKSDPSILSVKVYEKIDKNDLPILEAELSATYGTKITFEPLPFVSPKSQTLWTFIVDEIYKNSIPHVGRYTDLSGPFVDKDIKFAVQNKMNFSSRITRRPKDGRPVFFMISPIVDEGQEIKYVVNVVISLPTWAEELAELDAFSGITLYGVRHEDDACAFKYNQSEGFSQCLGFQLQHVANEFISNGVLPQSYLWFQANDDFANYHPIDIDPLWVVILGTLLSMVVSLVVRHLLDQRDRLDKAVKIKTADLGEALHQKEVLLRKMRQDICTPLHSVIGLNEAIKIRANDDIKSYLDSTHFALTRLLNQVEDVIDFKEINHQTIALSQEKIDLVQLLKDIETLTRATYPSPELTLVFSIADLPRACLTDYRRLKRVLINLLDNAIKHTSSGRVTLSVVVLEAKNGFATLQFDITDNGVGIESEELSKLINDSTLAAHQLDENRLGLFISLEILHKMKASISVKSEIDQGTQVMFTLKVPFVDDEKSTELSEQEKIAALQGQHIVVIDHNSSHVSLLLALLEPLDIIVTPFVYPHEAMKFMLNHPLVNTVICDINIPDMAGDEIYRFLRTHNFLGQIVALTDLKNLNQSTDGFKIPYDAYIVKPLDKETLISVLLHLLNK